MVVGKNIFVKYHPFIFDIPAESHVLGALGDQDSSVIRVETFHFGGHHPASIPKAGAA